jgi:glycosyltransferase involved in cell wall biosynthesis
MSQTSKKLMDLRKIGVIGNYLPRRCGIATFTTDLCESMNSQAPDLDVGVVALNDVSQGYRYPPMVRFEIGQNKLRDYRLAGDFLNINQFDLVCLQHEYGIFGGDAGSHILVLLRRLRMPIITTLHTVLKDPSEEQRLVLKELARLSDRFIVMSETAVAFLKDIYGVPESKIAFIHHGIPDLPFVDPNYYKDLLGVEGRRTILTFGLISPGKGIEYMIDALPRIVQKYPDVVYIVLGATHPHVKRASGEEYRLSLQGRALELDLRDHVLFQNRFVELEELSEFLGAADLYVTPYISEAQITSGTLAYALGSGKAIISTPYWYARDLLADQRGRLTQFRSAEDLADQCIDLLDHEVPRHSMRKRAYTYARDMVWANVARRYMEVFAEARAERRRVPRPFKSIALGSLGEELDFPEIDLKHMILLTDDTGILQHAKYSVPDRHHGYCTDDNARALIAALMASSLLPEDLSIEPLVARYLGFLLHAFDKRKGTFRSLMDYDRKWIAESPHADDHARALWALGLAARFGQSKGHVGLSVRLLQQSLPALQKHSTSPRSWAFAIIGIYHYLKRYHGDSECRRSIEDLATRLHSRFEEHATDKWPWPENSLSYANAKLPQALILSGVLLQREDMKEMGFRALDWLLRIQTSDSGYFSPVGTHGWLRRGGHKARFDQQPIEAHAMIDACIAAHRHTGDDQWIREARRCFEWFLGRNDLHLPLYDSATGGCRDGLHSDRVNENQGAESTLAWLMSLFTMYRHRNETALAMAKKSLPQEAFVGDKNPSS